MVRCRGTAAHHVGRMVGNLEADGEHDDALPLGGVADVFQTLVLRRGTHPFAGSVEIVVVIIGIIGLVILGIGTPRHRHAGPGFQPGKRDSRLAAERAVLPAAVRDVVPIFSPPSVAVPVARLLAQHVEIVRLGMTRIGAGTVLERVPKHGLIGVDTVRHEHDEFQRIGIGIGVRPYRERRVDLDIRIGDQPIQMRVHRRVQQRRAPLHRDVDRGIALRFQRIDLVFQRQRIVRPGRDIEIALVPADGVKDRLGVTIAAPWVEMRGLRQWRRIVDIGPAEIGRAEIHAMRKVVRMRGVHLRQKRGTGRDLRGIGHQ